MKRNMPQTDYTAMTNGFQLVMPLDCEVNIEKNAPVRLLNAVMERMDYSGLLYPITSLTMKLTLEPHRIKRIFFCDHW